MTSSESTGGPTSEPTSESTPAPAPKRRKRRLWLKIGAPLIVIPVLAVALWVWVTLGFVYSSGERTGYVKSLQQQGWLCKTWEGELTTPRTPTMADTTFEFTIRNDSVAKALQLAGSSRVTLSYAEHRGVPTSCFGETGYFVEGFRVDR
jgi:hypothetical protein